MGQKALPPVRSYDNVSRLIVFVGLPLVAAVGLLASLRYTGWLTVLQSCLVMVHIESSVICLYLANNYVEDLLEIGTNQLFYTHFSFGYP